MKNDFQKRFKELRDEAKSLPGAVNRYGAHDDDPDYDFQGFCIGYPQSIELSVDKRYGRKIPEVNVGWASAGCDGESSQRVLEFGKTIERVGKLAAKFEALFADMEGAE